MKHPPVKRIAVLLLVVAIGLVVNRVRHPPEDPNWVKGSGTVEATEIGVAAQGTGRIVRLLVAEGDQVAEGDTLAELNHDAVQADHLRSEAAAFSARMRLANLARGSRSEEVRARAAVLSEALANLAGARRQMANARDAYQRPPDLRAAYDAAATQVRATSAQMDQAKALLDEAKAGARPEELGASRAASAAAGAAAVGAGAAVDQADAAGRAAGAQLAEAEAAVKGAQSDLAQAEEILRQRSAATTQVAAAETQLESARAALAAAQARRDTVEAPPRPDRRDQAEQALSQARAALSLAEAEARRQRNLFEQGAVSRRILDQANTSLEQAQAAARSAEAGLKDLDAGARASERREVAASVAGAETAVRGAETALANARHEQAIAVAAARQAAERAAAVLAQANERRAQAQANVAQSSERLRGARATADQARSQSEQSQSLLALAEAGTRAERLAQTSAALRTAEAQHAGARVALSNAERAYRDRFTYRQNLLAAEQAATAAAARVDQAQAQLDLALAGNTSEVIEAARGELDQAQAAEKAARARLDDTVIRAPASGTVSEIILRQGEACTPGSVVVRMLDLAHQWVRVYLPTKAFTRIKRGQAVDVTADAFADPPRKFAGRVLTVSDQAEFTPKNAQTIEERVKQVFWVKIDVGDGQGLLKPGIPVDVRLRVGQSG